MQFATWLFLGLIGNFYSAVAAQASDANPESCIVPQVLFVSLPNPFTISVLVPDPSSSTSQATWALQLSPRDPSNTVASAPVISNTRIASPTFRLENQTLVTADDGFPARILPSIAIFPPPLTAFEFGGPYAEESRGTFSAIYDCDTTGQQFVKLVPDRGIFILLSISLVSYLCFIGSRLTSSAPQPPFS